MILDDCSNSYNFAIIEYLLLAFVCFSNSCLGYLPECLIFTSQETCSLFVAVPGNVTSELRFGSLEKGITIFVEITLEAQV
jgi:hypothetical protein